MLETRKGLLIAGKYELIEELASGGMGSVWAAQHKTLDAPVAVKFMAAKYAADDKSRLRFEREAKAAARLRSTNVVQILDSGVEQDTPYLVMERLCGQDLEARLKQIPRLSMDETLLIVTQIGKALRRAHEEGLVHRDLKPANIFLVKHHDELVVKVLDFGIAKWTGARATADATKTGPMLGTRDYMSPEQVKGAKDIDHRTDLWALGVIVYRMLTGRLPFPGKTDGAVLLKICTQRPLAPTQHVQDLDPRVDDFIAKALAVKVAKRFQNVKEMIDALTQIHASSAASTTIREQPSEAPDAMTRPDEPEVLSDVSTITKVDIHVMATVTVPDGVGVCHAFTTDADLDLRSTPTSASLDDGDVAIEVTTVPAQTGILDGNAMTIESVTLADDLPTDTVVSADPEAPTDAPPTMAPVTQPLPTDGEAPRESDPHGTKKRNRKARVGLVSGLVVAGIIAGLWFYRTKQSDENAHVLPVIQSAALGASATAIPTEPLPTNTGDPMEVPSQKALTAPSSPASSGKARNQEKSPSPVKTRKTTGAPSALTISHTPNTTRTNTKREGENFGDE